MREQHVGEQRHFEAIVIGAGVSGIYQIKRLVDLGLDTVLLEADDDLGGTWYRNRYPGARFDSESYTYGYSFSKEVLEAIDFEANSDDFVFDNQMLSQIFMKGFEIGEVTCPTKYFEEASSINFSRSVTYGFGVLKTSLMHRLHMWGVMKFGIYGDPKKG